MKKLLPGIVFMLLARAAYAQVSITGIVTDAATHKPLANASVFLNNATIGDHTDESGRYHLRNVRPGKYKLVVSIVGYEAYNEQLLIENTDIDLHGIALIPHVTSLAEVVVRPDPGWAKNFEAFKRDFLGTSKEAAFCKIRNPDAVNVHFDTDSNQLTATSNGFIEVENKALGYVI